MKIIVPMAGMGKRMRPHTLTTPKPLISIAGKSIVERLVEDIARMSGEKIEEVAFVIGDFGKEVENSLLAIAKKIGSIGKIYYQDEPLGTAHAILCAGPSLSGNVFVAFADTLFDADFDLDLNKDGIIYTKKIENPEAFGVVVTDQNGIITKLVEKPTEFVSDLAIIGIYYFKDGNMLKSELQYLIDNDIKDKGEFQLTSAMDNMKNKGLALKAEKVNLWLDCGNKDATVDTNKEILKLKKNENQIHESVVKENAVIIEPCYIGPGVKIVNSVVGPYTSVGADTVIQSSVIENSIVANNTKIKGVNIKNSMIGQHVSYQVKSKDVSIGDYTKIS
jgi:glucose-1-phosphate thymidylyltransferase